MPASALKSSSRPGAGALALYPDEEYEAAGAKVVESSRELFDGADLVVKVLPPTIDEVDQLPEGISLLSFLAPSAHLDAGPAVGRATGSLLSVSSWCRG